MQYILNFNEVDKLFELVLVLLGFYVLYAIQNVFDSTFYGLGKTNYMLFESVVTNTIYYGGVPTSPCWASCPDCVRILCRNGTWGSR